MNLQQLSQQFTVRSLTERDISAIYTLSLENPLFYRHCPPFVSKQSIENDMNALPPGKSKDDKYYVGYFEQDSLVAVMDFYLEFPDSETVYIGLFMMNQGWQGKGIGTNIISEFAACAKTMGYRCIRLGYAKGNPQSETFWLKNHFEKSGTETIHEEYTAVSMLRKL